MKGLDNAKTKESKVNSLCEKTLTTALFSFLKHSFTNSKILSFKNFEKLVFKSFLSKTENSLVFLQPLNSSLPSLYISHSLSKISRTVFLLESLQVSFPSGV